MTECKDRWKNIRGSYSKYRAKLKTKSGQGAKRVKEYYLAPYLLFLDPFLKSRKSKGNIDEESDTLSNEEEAGMSEHEANTDNAEVLSLDNNSTLSMASPRSPLPSPSTSTHTEPIPQRNDFIRKRKKAASAISINDVNNQAYQYFEKKQHMLESQNMTKKTNTTMEPLDPDLAFLHSVLPDMKSMNSTQKRHFKMGILNLSEQILSSTTSAVPAPPTTISQCCSGDSVNTNLNSMSQRNTEASGEPLPWFRSHGNNSSGGPAPWSTHSMDRNLKSTFQGNTEASRESFNMNEFIQYNNN